MSSRGDAAGFADVAGGEAGYAGYCLGVESSTTRAAKRSLTIGVVTCHVA